MLPGRPPKRRRNFLKLVELCTATGRREADTMLVYDVSRFSRLDPGEAGFPEFSLRRAAAPPVGRRHPPARCLRLIAAVPGGRLARGLFARPPAGRHQRQLPLVSAAP